MNSEYWEKRVANETWNLYNSLEKNNINVKEFYQEAILDIEEELYQVSKKLDGSNPTLSDMHKYNRLTNLKSNMENIVKELTKEIEKFGQEQLHKAIEESYKNVMININNLEFALPNKKLIDMMLNNPWSGENFSDRLWGNSKILARNLNEILTRGLIQGKTIIQITKELQEKMLTGLNSTLRLIRTETMHYLNESAFKAYEDAGLKQIEYCAALDERTCKSCGSLHGKVYSIKNRPILPLHPNCRCTYLPIIDIK